jgi:hypothetical protein
VAGGGLGCERSTSPLLNKTTRYLKDLAEAALKHHCAVHACVLMTDHAIRLHTQQVCTATLCRDAMAHAVSEGCPQRSRSPSKYGRLTRT